MVLWGRLAPCLVAAMEQLTPHDLSQVLWAYATAGMAHKVGRGSVFFGGGQGGRFVVMITG